MLARFPADKSLRLGQAKFLAAQHVEQRQFQAAVTALSSAVEDFPQDLELRNLRAGAYMKLSAWSAAEADYARVIELETDEGRRRTAQRVLAEIQLRRGQFQAGAEAFLEEMLISRGDYYRTRDAYTALLLAGHPGSEKVAARRFYESFHATKDASQARWLLRAFTAQPGLITNENRPQLLALAKSVEGTWAAPMTAAIHYRSGDLKQAERLLTTSRDKPQYESLAAMLLYDQGKISEARKLLNQGSGRWFQIERAQDPRSAIPAQQSWQEWSMNLAAWREAARKLIGPRIKELDDLLAKEPGTAPERLERARLLAEAGLHDEALDDLDRLAAQQAASPDVQAQYGRVLAAMNLHEEALARLNLAVEAGSQDAAALAARGAILLKQGQTEQARADLERALQLDPSEAAANALADLLLAKPPAWTVLQPIELKSSGGTILTRQEDESILTSGPNPDAEDYTIVADSSADSFRWLRLEVLPHHSNENGSTGRSVSGRFTLTEVTAALSASDRTGEAEPFRFNSAWAPIRGDLAGQAIDGKLQSTGDAFWNAHPYPKEPTAAIFELALPPGDNRRSRVTVNLHFHSETYKRHNLGRFRLSVTGDPKVYEWERARLATTNPWVGLAQARLLNSDSAGAVSAFVRAFDRAADATERADVVEQASVHGDIFPEFRQRLDGDPHYHLLLGQRLAATGKRDEAAAEYQRAKEIDAGMASDWIQTGFWKLEGYPSNLRSEYPPDVHPDPLQPVASVAVAGREQPEQLSWQPVVPVNGQIKFVSQDIACHYVLTHLWSPIEQEVAFQMGDDDQMRLFVNDRLLFESPSGQPGGSKPKEHELAVKLQAGWNTVLLKIRNSNGPSSVILTLTNESQDLIVARAGSRVYQARQLIDAKKTDEAIALLAAELPPSADLFIKRADAYKQLKRWEQAEADCRRATELEPDNASRWFSLGDNLHSQRKWEPAIASLTRHLALQKGNGFALIRRGDCFAALRRWEEAFADYDQAITTRTEQWKHTWQNARTNLRMRRGEWAPAALELQQVFDAGADVSKSWAFARDLALAQLMAGDLELYRKAAAEMFQRLSGDLTTDQAKWLVYVFTAAPEMINDANRDRLTFAAGKVDSYWSPRLKAALLFRGGEFEPAADQFAKSTGGPAFQFLAAMANQRAQRTGPARQLFDQGSAWLEQQRASDPNSSGGVPRGNFNWQDWATILTLQREAAGQLASPP